MESENRGFLPGLREVCFKFETLEDAKEALEFFLGEGVEVKRWMNTVRISKYPYEIAEWIRFAMSCRELDGNLVKQHGSLGGLK